MVVPMVIIVFRLPCTAADLAHNQTGTEAAYFPLESIDNGYSHVTIVIILHAFGRFNKLQCLLFLVHELGSFQSRHNVFVWRVLETANSYRIPLSKCWCFKTRAFAQMVVLVDLVVHLTLTSKWVGVIIVLYSGIKVPYSYQSQFSLSHYS